MCTCERMLSFIPFGWSLIGIKAKKLVESQTRRRGDSRGSNEPPMEVNNGGLKT